jgi:acetyl-CoA C-acetyltransferase
MHMTKHVAGVYSTTPAPVGAATEPPTPEPDVAIIDAHNGEATVATYSVIHGREGAEWALLVCDVGDGARCYARADDPDLLAALETDEWVGRRVTIAHDGARNTAVA